MQGKIRLVIIITCSCILIVFSGNKGGYRTMNKTGSGKHPPILFSLCAATL